MKKIKNIFGSKKEKKSTNPTGSLSKYNQSEVDGFLVLSSNEPINLVNQKIPGDYFNILLYG